MKLETNNVTVKKSQKELFQFLSNLENFEQLMPENIEKFEVDGDSFIFGLKGMPEIRLVLKEQTEFNQIVLGAASSKLPFTLSVNIPVQSITTSALTSSHFKSSGLRSAVTRIVLPSTTKLPSLTSTIPGNFP